MSKKDYINAKKYFIKSISKIKSKSYKIKSSNENRFSDLKNIIFNCPSFNLQNQINLPSDFISIFTKKNLHINENNSNEDTIASDNSNKELINSKELNDNYRKNDKNMNKSIEFNTGKNNDFENINDLFEYAISDNSLENDFKSEIKEIIKIMNKILYTPPYPILFGRIIISVPKKNIDLPKGENITQSFYEGFGI